MSGRMLVVSAGHLLARGYLAIPADRKSDKGVPTNALYGVTRSLLRAMALKVPDLAVAVIGPIADTTPDLTAQLQRLGGLLEAHGIKVVFADDEANTVASYTRAAVEDGDDVVVLGSDKRYAQLVADGVWWYDAYKDARYTSEMVVKRFLVEPDKVDQWLALVGDDDYLPGIKGIGKKGAKALIDACGSVRQALEQLESLDTRTRNALSASVEQVPIELARARLDRSVALPAPLSELVFSLPDNAARNALYADLNFFELLSDESVDERAPVIVENAGAIAGLGDGPLAIHVITDDPSPVRGALVGLAISGPSEDLYLPNPTLAAAWLVDPTKPKIGHDTNRAVVAFARKGITIRGIIGDTTCASHLLEPSNLAPHDLPIVARQIVRRALPSDDEVRGVGRHRKPWSKLPVNRVAAYACAFASASLAVWDELEDQTNERLLAEYLALSETVARMELRGIGVDKAELARVGEDFLVSEGKLEAQIFELAGKSFNLASTKQLGSVLFEDLALTILKRTKTGWSTATEALERIQHEHPIVPLVIHWRALQRMRVTWITALSDCIDDDGRVRSTFHPARSFSGRLVNSSPDLGRVPGRTEEMQRIRRAFVAAPGHVLLSLDYVQLGLHVLAHLTKDPELVEPLRRHDDMHTLTTSAVLEIPVEDVTRDKRQIGKVTNFATFAGQGASALSQQLGISPAEAKLLIERFDKRYHVVRAFQDEQLRLAKTQGYIVTIAGRRWPIAALESLDPMDRSYAERLARRATHEGSVADVSRRGLLEADRALGRAKLEAAPLLQIHDEVLFEVPTGEVEQAAQIASEAMAKAFELEVPLRVGKKVGPNWADLSPL